MSTQPVTIVDERGNFWTEIFDTANSAVDYVGDALQNASGQASAVININNAQADAIRTEQQRKTETMRSVLKIVILTVVCVTVVAVFSILKKST